MVRHSLQSWEVGQTVAVGFLRGLVVVEKMPTPGDHAPDAYVLRRTVTVMGRDAYEKRAAFYRFVPHRGIERRVSLADARRP